MSPKIKMTKTSRGYDKKRELLTFKEGEEYEVGDSLAKAFVSDMMCAEYVEKGNQVEYEKKVVVPNQVKEQVESSLKEVEASIDGSDELDVEDIEANIKSFNDKDELESYVNDVLGIDLDKRKALKTMKANAIKELKG